MPAVSKARRLGCEPEELCTEGGPIHSWQGTGLDVVTDRSGVDVLAETRRCVWCGKRQWRPYDERRRTWREARP